MKIFIGTNKKLYTNGYDDNMGYMGVALQVAFYELLHATSFSRGLENIIKIGGDVDTNACIAGALLGAYYGVDNIPADWIKAVECADPYMGCKNNERSKIPMDMFCIKDVDELLSDLANINQ